MNNAGETVREVCFDVETLTDITLKEGGVFLPREVSAHFERFLSAHEREMAAKDAEIEHLNHALETIKKSRDEVRSDYQHLLGIRDVRIALLERALRPVMECKVYECDYGLYTGRGFEQTNVRSMFHNAVREAQRIMKESYNGESHN